MDAVSGGTDFLGPVQTWVPLLGGFGILIWLVWRLFWKVDRRSQQELSVKDKKILELETRIKDLQTATELQLAEERNKRYIAQEIKANADARESSLRTQIEELTKQVQRQSVEIESLRQEIARALHSPVPPVGGNS